MPIINSLLDLDFYKLTQGQFIFSKYPKIVAEYKMKIRNGNEIDYWTYVPFSQYEEEIKSLKDLSLTADEANYLRSLGYFTEEYITFLSNKPMNGVNVLPDYQGGNLVFDHVPIVKGMWASSMLYETFCLSIGNEIYAKNYARDNQISWEAVLDTATLRLTKKMTQLNEYNSKQEIPVRLIEFGTRRRMSQEWQELVVCNLHFADLIAGTSNVKLAQLNKIQPVGTQAHELYMGMQGIAPVHLSETRVLYEWLEFYNGKLAVALSDTLGTDKFLRDFHFGFAEVYSGVRHDSGDTYKWGRQMINMYEGYKINPKKKTLMFSDGLNFNKMISLHHHFSPEINVTFGIGTDLTNDSFLPVPQAVMKMTHCNGQPVAKLSNNPEKATCPSKEYLEYVKYVAEKL